MKLLKKLIYRQPLNYKDAEFLRKLRPFFIIMVGVLVLIIMIRAGWMG